MKRKLVAMLPDSTILFAAMLLPEEVPGALRLVSLAEATGQLSPGEADTWRVLLSAWYGYRSLEEAERREGRRRPAETSLPSSRGAA